MKRLHLTLRQLVSCAAMKAAQQSKWTIGQLARTSGLTVRALRHYEQLGLLAGVGRSEGRQRLYGAHEVRQLYRIRALRDLGLPLREIQALLRSDTSEAVFAAVLAKHRVWVSKEIERMQRLLAMIEMVAGGQPESVEALLALVEATSRVARHAAARRQARSSTGTAEAWSAVARSLRTCMEAGLGPASRRATAAGRRALSLIEEFTGGDVALKQALKTLREAGPIAFGEWDRALFQYLEQVLKGLQGQGHSQ